MKLFRGSRFEAARFLWRAAVLIVPALLISGVAQAQTQYSNNFMPINCSGTISFGQGSPVENLGFLGSTAGAISSTISSVVGGVNTAFLGQQGSAFISAPGNPAPDQAGGGVWARALAGEVTTKSGTSNTGAGSGVISGNDLNTRCSNSVQQFYSGMQVGTDLSRLNINGWNVHVGATAGYLGSTASDDNAGSSGMRSAVEVPFLGGYVAATHGNFFADLMVRGDFYNLNLASPGLGLESQPMGARGLSVSASAGYKFSLPDNYFIEPSAGFVWSNTKVDPVHTTVPDGFYGYPTTIGGTVATSDVASRIGRLGVRAGTTITTSNVVYQPFVSASVFHEFAGDVQASYSFCPGCSKLQGDPTAELGYTQQSRTSRVGTYGQFSAGLAAQIVDTGWLGFVRADYRTGSNIEGYAGNIGLRYQFSPDAARPLQYVKAPLAASAVSGATDWSGLYAGVFAGAAAGRTNITFADAPATGNTSPVSSGAIGGLQAGYNHQINNWVFGVEGELGFAGLNGARPCGTEIGSQSFDPYFQTCKDRMNWTGSVAGRLGYSTGRTLFYGKAGVAWADGQVGVNCIDGAPTVYSHCWDPNNNRYPNSMPMDTANGNYATGNGYGTSASYSRFGWLVGLGTEFDLGRNWSAKAEYDYTSFGPQTVTAADGVTRLTSRNALNQVKIGLNYRFGGDGSAAAAVPLFGKVPFAKAPDVAAIHNWTGFYIGGNVAAALASTDNEINGGVTGGGSFGSYPVSGGLIGGQIGYRAQFGRVVLGVEAQGNWASMRGSNVSPFATGYFPDGLGVASNRTHYETWTDQTHIDGVGVFTGQVGTTIFDTLFYMKGGAVVTAQRADAFLNSGDSFYQGVYTPSETDHLGHGNNTVWGAAVGGGAEYAFSSNWSAGIDYVHGFLGTRIYDLPKADGSGTLVTDRTRQSLDMLSLRVNYSFAPRVFVQK